MLEQLVLLHRLGGGAPLAAPDWLEVKTCLRSFWLGLKDWGLPEVPQEGWETFTGPRAYSELLEIACGLKSPVLGETEVFGQIKRACQAYEHSRKRCHGDFQKIIQKMYADVKSIRTLHLKSTGSKSYGSYARKFFRGCSVVRVLGTGPLAQEILPWLTKSTEQVIVHSRTPHLRGDLETSLQVRVQGLTDVTGPLRCGLLVAAPMGAAEIEKFISQIEVERVLDLREESATDPLPVEVPYEKLQEVFEVFERTRASSQHIKELALAEIQKCVQTRFKDMEFRPEGWDECAG